MPEVRLRVLNKVGLHARPAVLFVKTAKKFSSNISVGKGGSWANAKSIIELLSLDVRCGDEIIVRAEGEDADKALSELKSLIEEKFGEE